CAAGRTRTNPRRPPRDSAWRTSRRARRVMSFREVVGHTAMTISTHSHSRATDESAFAGQVQQHRRELHVHCYRMLGSFDDCEDMVQETFLRAWRSRSSFAGRSSVRAWLYKIATNACLDALDKRPRVPVSGEISWLQ